MSATLSSPDDIHGRQLAAPTETAAAASSTASWDIAATSAHIRRGFRRVALQFPDALLHLAPKVMAALAAELHATHTPTAESPAPAQLFALADTSFDGYQLDFVAAQHVAADLLVHYGPADLGAQGPIEARYVFGDEAVDVSAVAAAVAAAFPPDQPVIIVPALRYAHAARELAAALTAVRPRAMVATTDVECRAEGGGAAAAAAAASSAAAPAAGDSAVMAAAAVASAVGLGEAGGACVELLGRRLPRALSREELYGSALLYLGGSEEATLSNLVVLLSSAPAHVYDLGAASAAGAASCVVRVELPTAKRMMRRYFLVQQAKEAAVVGILVGTLSASRRTPMLAALKRLIRARGRKHYVFLMGKLNAAKLANFTEVGAYVLLGSAEHSLIDAKDFYRPVVTPFELMLAFGSAAEWTGEYLLDYAPLLPRLAAAAAAEEEGGGAAALESDEDEPPEHSLLSGRLIGAAGCEARGGGAASEEAEGGALATTGGALAATGAYALARTGAEFLARRTWRGLELRLGEDAPAQVQMGRRGIASGFDEEGTGGGGGTGGASGRAAAAPVAAAAAGVSAASRGKPQVCVRVVATGATAVVVKLRCIG